MNQLTLHLDQSGPKISRHIYGHFIEHLGTVIYDGLWVGEDSPITNTRGLRNDVLTALKALKVPNIRWPGGCFAEIYNWRDGIGPRSQRPTNPGCWSCDIEVGETNQFGTHEFMDLCELLGSEPYICGNLGSGTPREMGEWIEYITRKLSPVSRLAQLRAANGRTPPWKLKYWAVGNENWGCGGNMTAQHYAWEYRRYQTFCRSHAPEGDDYSLSGAGLYKVACGRDDAWNEIVAREAGDFMEAISIHHYCRDHVDTVSWTLRGEASGFNEPDWWTYLGMAHQMDDFIRRTIAILDRHAPQRRIGVVVDEWGTWYLVEAGKPTASLYQQNSIRDAVIAAHTLHIFHRHAERVHMANIAQMVNCLQSVILTDGPRMVCTPTYHVFEMFKVHQEAVSIPCEVACLTRQVGTEAVPCISAAATRSDDGSINLSLCNLDPVAAQSCACRLDGSGGSAFLPVSGRVLAGSAMDSCNTFDVPDAVAPDNFAGAKLSDGCLHVELPPRSVVILQLRPAPSDLKPAR